MEKELKIKQMDKALEKLYDTLPRVSVGCMKECAIAITLLECQKKKLKNDN